MTPPPPRSSLFPYTTLFRSCVFDVGDEFLVPVANVALSCSNGQLLVKDGQHRDRRGGASINTAQRYGTAASGEVKCRVRSEEHTSELQSRGHLVCRLLLEKK